MFTSRLKTADFRIRLPSSSLYFSCIRQAGFSLLRQSFAQKTTLQPREIQSDDLPSAYDALLIVGLDARIKFSSWNGNRADQEWMTSDNGTRLSAALTTRFEEIVGSDVTVSGTPTIVVRQGAKTLRLSRLDGHEILFALVLEGDRNDGKMLRAVSRYRLTQRQSEVLALLLDGASASDVARSLVISEYTAQGYVKCLLAKTTSRNRAEMVAKVLGWKSPTPVSPPATRLGILQAV